MLVYLTDKKDFYQGNTIDYSLKNAIAKAGGNQKHHLLFKELLQHSIWNNTINMPLHDTRAAQVILFLYPVNIRIFLSLVLYKEEVKIYNNYSADSLNKNINTPSTHLYLANVIDKITISSRINRYLDNLPEDFILEDSHLSPLKTILNIKEYLSFQENTLRENLQRVFNVFNNSFNFNNKIIEIAYNNNRLEAASAICRALNYRSVGTNLVLQSVEKWQNQYLNI